MTATVNATLDRIRSMLAEKGYEVSEPAPNTLNIRELESGVPVHAVLEGDILYFSLNCTVVPESSITPEIMGLMLAGDNGISTSAFQLYPAGEGKVAVTLNNFCKLQEMGADDEDDILSCVHFLLVDVMAARTLLKDLR